MKQGAHTYHGQKIGRADRLLSKLGPLAKIRPEVWLSVFPGDQALTGKKQQSDSLGRSGGSCCLAPSQENIPANSADK